MLELILSQMGLLEGFNEADGEFILRNHCLFINSLLEKLGSDVIIMTIQR